MKKHTMTMRDESHLHSTMKKLSVEHGGAIVAHRQGFSHDFKFSQFKNPSSVPDSMHDLVGREMAFKGEVRGFTPAAVRREANRGLRRS